MFRPLYIKNVNKLLCTQKMLYCIFPPYLRQYICIYRDEGRKIQRIYSYLYRGKLLLIFGTLQGSGKCLKQDLTHSPLGPSSATVFIVYILFMYFICMKDLESHCLTFRLVYQCKAKMLISAPNNPNGNEMETFPLESSLKNNWRKCKIIIIMTQIVVRTHQNTLFLHHIL